MVSNVNITVTHVSTSCVTDRTDSVHTVVLKALKETVVNFQTVVLARMVLTVRLAVILVSTEYVTDLTESVYMVVLVVLMETVVI